MADGYLSRRQFVAGGAAVALAGMFGVMTGCTAGGSGAAAGAALILQFKPYIAKRFEAWRHVWEFADTSG